MPEPSASRQIHPEGNAIFGYDGGNHFDRNGKARPRANIAASENHGERKKATYSRAKTHTALGPGTKELPLTAEHYSYK